MNVGNQNFVFEHDFTRVENLLFKFEWMDGGTIYCYKIYLLIYKVENNWNYKKLCKHIFYAINEKSSPVIFNNLALQKKINGDTQAWCFKFDKHAYELLPPEKFAETLGNDFFFYFGNVRHKHRLSAKP